MPGDKIHLGALGERSAISFLKSKRFTILETNYRTRFCEIDIVARHDGFTCFIEVKTRRSLKKGLPKEAVNFKKQNKIIQGAQYYMKEKKQDNLRIRFDVVEVIFNRQEHSPQINLIKNAFWTA